MAESNKVFPNKSNIDLFAGVPVRDYATSLPWYEQLLGCPPSFNATDTESIWELAEHRWLFIEQRPDHAGHAIPTIMVEDLDSLVAQIAERGLEPTKVEDYGGGVRKLIYVDPDGNEIGFGSLPQE